MDRKIVRIRFLNNIDLKTPISIEEFESLPTGELMAKIDDVIYEYFQKNCWGTVSPIYEDELITFRLEPLTENDVLAESDVDVWGLLGNKIN